MTLFLKKKPSGGRIIFLSTSLTVATNVLPNAVVYVASKGAIEQAARSLAKDLGARGITVNVVSPGPIDTPLFRADKPEPVINFIAGLHPLNRVGKPEEVAPIVTFLAGPGAAWVNGQNIRVNGVCIASLCFFIVMSDDRSSRALLYECRNLAVSLHQTFVLLVLKGSSNTYDTP